MDIENYLKPLTNNERAVLLTAARVRGGMHYIERTQSISDDLSRYGRKVTKVPAAQVDKAVESLLAKGYITLEPKRGNYIFRERLWQRWRYAHNGSMATMISVFRKKMAGGLPAVDWVDIAIVTPVEDVKSAVDKYRHDAEMETLRERLVLADRVALRQKELENKMLRMCERYVAQFGGAAVTGKSPFREQSDPDLTHYMPYECDEIIREMSSTAKEMERWTFTRRDIERNAKRAAEELEGMMEKMGKVLA